MTGYFPVPFLFVSFRSTEQLTDDEAGCYLLLVTSFFGFVLIHRRLSSTYVRGGSAGRQVLRTELDLACT